MKKENETSKYNVFYENYISLLNFHIKKKIWQVGILIVLDDTSFSPLLKRTTHRITLIILTAFSLKELV